MINEKLFVKDQWLHSHSNRSLKIFNEGHVVQGMRLRGFVCCSFRSTRPTDFAMASACMIIQRGIATSCVCNGKRNFRKFLLPNKRGTRNFKAQQRIKPNPDVPIDHRGVRPVGYEHCGQFIEVPEMIPEIIVPSLEGFTLKPYVAYHTDEVHQSEFTPQDLFNSIYAEKIADDFRAKKLAEDGSPLQPSEQEKLTAEEAKLLAGKTGCDLFG